MRNDLIHLDFMWTLNDRGESSPRWAGATAATADADLDAAAQCSPPHSCRRRVTPTLVGAAATVAYACAAD